MPPETNKIKNKTAANLLDVKSIKKDFPILAQPVNGNRLVYLDNAASTHKPIMVVDAHKNFIETSYSNIHRGLHTLADRATNAYEKTRDHVARFIGGVKREEIIFTHSTTEAINLIAYTWGEQHINEGDEIVISEMEHHANLVPWVILAQKKKAVLKRIPLTADGQLDLSNLNNIITPKTKLVAICHMSNVLGTINPVKEITEAAHKQKAVVLIDGAQAVPHMPVDVLDIDADFYVFSAHKMMGPTGVGVLYGKENILDSMPPFNMGGEMINEVFYDRITWNELPHKFEAGTPNIAGVAAFDATLDYIENIGLANIHNYEKYLSGYTLEKLLAISGIEIQGPLDPEVRGCVFSFTDNEVHPHDISTFLDTRGIAIRAGHHCAQPLMRTLNKVATARASMYIYNDIDDIDLLCEALLETRRYFGL